MSVTIKMNSVAVKELEEEAIKHIENIANAVKDRAKELVSGVVLEVRTGDLREAIDVQPVEDKKERVIGVRHEKLKYAIYQEMGFVHYQSGKFVGPNAYMRPALDEVIAKLK